MKIFLIASFGSLFQEFLHICSLAKTLNATEFKVFVKSPIYYSLAIATIILSGLWVALAYGDERSKLPPLVIMILGAAAPALFKQAVSAMVKPRGDLGGKGDSEVKKLLTTYFKIR
jgi:hypothetical protein